LLGDQEAVSRDAQRGVMMKAAPAAALVVVEPGFLFEFLIIALDASAHFGDIDEIAEFGFRRKSQYLVGAVSPGGHSINSVSSGRPAAALIGAVRTRTRAKRDVSFSAEPSRQMMESFGRPNATVFTLTRFCGSAMAHTLRSAEWLRIPAIADRCSD
jgi:hypothetical protein